MISQHFFPRGTSINLFWVAWSLGIGIGDVYLGFQTFRQSRTYWFQPVDAVLDQLEFRRVRRNRKTIAVTKYRYSVGENEHVSQRYDFFDQVIDENTGKSWLPRSAVGEKLTAYFDPRAPQVSVLRSGFRIADLWRFLPLIIFNIIPVIGAIIMLDWLAAKWRGRPSIEFRIREYGNEVQLRFYRYSPLLSAVSAAGIAAVGASLFMAFVPYPWIGLNRMIFISLFLIGASTIVVYLKSSRSYVDLTVNRAHFHVTIDKSKFEKNSSVSPKMISLDKIPDIAIYTVESAKGDSNTHWLGLCLFDDQKKWKRSSRLPTAHFQSNKDLLLYRFYKMEEAERMAAWLGNFGFSLGRESATSLIRET